MGLFRKLLVAGLGALSLVGGSAVSVGAAGDRLVEFDSMTPVTGAAVGATNDRGLKGGGLPWAIDSGRGSVDRQGRVDVRVTGLVLDAGPKVGTNPLSPFNAVVSCVTPHGVVNVPTAGFPAGLGGDSTIAGAVALPHPCKKAEVFVGFTNPSTGAFIWFAVSNVEGED